jgi:hypothetical protein
LFPVKTGLAPLRPIKGGTNETPPNANQQGTGTPPPTTTEPTAPASQGNVQSTTEADQELFPVRKDLVNFAPQQGQGATPPPTTTEQSTTATPTVGQQTPPPTKGATNGQPSAPITSETVAQTSKAAIDNLRKVTLTQDDTKILQAEKDLFNTYASDKALIEVEVPFGKGVTTERYNPKKFIDATIVGSAMGKPVVGEVKEIVYDENGKIVRARYYAPGVKPDGPPKITMAEPKAEETPKVEAQPATTKQEGTPPTQGEQVKEKVSNVVINDANDKRPKLEFPASDSIFYKKLDWLKQKSYNAPRGGQDKLDYDKAYADMKDLFASEDMYVLFVENLRGEQIRRRVPVNEFIVESMKKDRSGQLPFRGIHEIRHDDNGRIIHMKVWINKAYDKSQFEY